MTVGLILMFACVLFFFTCLLAGEIKAAMICFLGMLLGAFLYFDVPKIFPQIHWQEIETTKTAK